MGRLLKAAATACLLISLLGTARAGLVRYDLTLTIESIDAPNGCAENPLAIEFGSVFGCSLAVGDAFQGGFSVDSSILAIDGPTNSAAIFDFFLPFGAAYYSTGADNKSLLGFRNPALGASAPGFLIEGGQVVDLIGGLYGVGDYPFIDFSGFLLGNRFNANDNVVQAQGALAIATVPLPSALVLMLTGLGAMWLAALYRGRHRDRCAVGN